MSGELNNHYIFRLDVASSQDLDWVWRKTIGKIRMQSKKVEISGAVTKVDAAYWDSINQGHSAAERALLRIESRVGIDRDLLAGMGYAADILRRELARYHGE